jgi:hypothetical protein
MPELLAPRKVTSINSKGRFLTSGEPLPLVVFSVSPGWLYCQLPRVVCQNCWLPAEKDQPSNGDSVSENSFGRFLTTGEPLPPVVFSAFLGWLPEVVHQNCWLCAEKNQHTYRDSVSENSFIWLLPLLF